MTQRQRLRVVAEMLFYLNTIKRIMLILFLPPAKRTRGQPIACVAQDERQSSQLLFHLAKGSVESVYEIVTRHNINHFSYNILIYSTVVVA
ncbi:hypothetical protein ACULNC_13255 [Shigella flexneri]